MWAARIPARRSAPTWQTPCVCWPSNNDRSKNGGPRATWLARGLPPDLLTNLGEEIRRFEAVKDAVVVARQRFTAATESIRESQNRAGETVAALKAIADNTPAAHPEVLTKLRNARRVGQRPAGPGTKPLLPPTPPSPIPAGTAALRTSGLM